MSHAIARHKLREQIAVELGLSAPPPPRQRVARWTPELIRAELDEFLGGRDTRPVISEFEDAGLAGLRTRLSADGTVDWWAAQYGLKVRHARPRAAANG
jgi:hypothetical protein